MKVCCLAVSSALHFGCSVLQCKRNAPPPSHLLTQKCEGCPYWFTPCGWLPGDKAKGTCQTERRAPPLFCRAAAKRPQSLPCAAAEVSGGAAVWGSRPSCHGHSPCSLAATSPDLLPHHHTSQVPVTLIVATPPPRQWSGGY